MWECMLKGSVMDRGHSPIKVDRSTLEHSLMDSMKEKESMYGHQEKSMSVIG
jgi:hypothetical protein